MTPRPAGERGHVRLDWLESFHSFSFGSYQDPRHMGISNLRVINEDLIAPASGFPTHGHEDMEIVTYLLDGALEHKDSLGNGSIMRPGDVQRMSAGRGVRHSEFNPSRTSPTHLLQIWLLPNRRGIEPGYEQRHFPREGRHNRLALLVSPDGRDGSISAQQDASLFGTILSGGGAVDYRLGDGRQAYVHVARGAARVNDRAMAAGDAVHLRAETSVRIEGADDAEILLFDLP
jgi:quercetin 2,3-dioxygenase